MKPAPTGVWGRSLVGMGSAPTGGRPSLGVCDGIWAGLKPAPTGVWERSLVGMGSAPTGRRSSLGVCDGIWAGLKPAPTGVWGRSLVGMGSAPTGGRPSLGVCEGSGLGSSSWLEWFSRAGALYRRAGPYFSGIWARRSMVRKVGGESGCRARSRSRTSISSVYSRTASSSRWLKPRVFSVCHVRAVRSETPADFTACVKVRVRAYW